jgi:hypothetical protein
MYLPRPGHADLVGVLKYDRRDTRDILERASARETAARVACAAVARRLLSEFGIEIGSHVRSIGDIECRPLEVLPEDLNAAADASPVRTLDPEAGERMVETIDRAREAGDTLGGIFEGVATGVPVGLGSHVSWDRKLDGRLAGAMMSIQAIKGVEIGLGFEGARRPGSRVHDPIVRDDGGGPYRQSERGAIYREHFHRLEQSGHAYPCFCTATELDIARRTQLAAGQPPRYPGTCRSLDATARAARLASGRRPALRFRVPESGSVEFDDLVRGPQSFAPREPRR